MRSPLTRAQDRKIKTILCFGDSNTWGSSPGGAGRHPWHIRWPGALQHLLGSEGRVIEEGLPGRTTCIEDPCSSNRNGLEYLPVALESHSPLDALIIMLGTNDLKPRFARSPEEIAEGIEALLEVAKVFQPPIEKILVISPPHIVPTADPNTTEQFQGGRERSTALAALYERVASQKGVAFFDASTVAVSSPVDGIHLDAANHGALASGLSLLFSEFSKE